MKIDSHKESNGRLNSINIVERLNIIKTCQFDKAKQSGNLFFSYRKWIEKRIKEKKMKKIAKQNKNR